MKRLFFGGVHPQYQKEMSAHDGGALRTVCGVRIVLPMRQHIGAPCTPLVCVGEYVRRGQKIGDGEEMCVPVHASVSGTVTAVEMRPHPTLGQVLAVEIENDGRDEAVPPAALPTSDDEILHAIREAGIVGMGGAAFPANVKALSAMGKIDTLIANACECEPYITADDCLLRTAPGRVLDGMRILASLLHPEKTVLAIEDNKPGAIASVRTLLAQYPEISLTVLPTRYPQGAEKQLVQSVTGKEVPPGQLPNAVGCAVFNVSTFAAIADAVLRGLPLTERIVTVTGEAAAKPQNFLVRIGTSVGDVIAAAGGVTGEDIRLICGGPMMGVAVETPDVPTVKATGCILCLPREARKTAEHPVCLRCGKCVGVCPMKLQPLYLYRYTNRRDAAALQRLHLADCMECGCCSFVCPGGLPLTARFREGKQFLRQEEGNA